MSNSLCVTSLFHFFSHHPAGPKTIHFWAPTFKWVRVLLLIGVLQSPSVPAQSYVCCPPSPRPQGLVIAGIADINRPAHKLSVRQSTALAATGKYNFIRMQYANAGLKESSGKKSRITHSLYLFSIST